MADEMTYTRCQVCKGSQLKTLFGLVSCHCHKSRTPGWAETGVTLDQLERFADWERALAGDPGMLGAKRQLIVSDLYRRALRAAKREGLLP